MVFIERGWRGVTVQVFMRRLLIVGDGVSVQMKAAQRNRQERNAGQCEDECRNRTHAGILPQEHDDRHQHIPLERTRNPGACQHQNTFGEFAPIHTRKDQSGILRTWFLQAAAGQMSTRANVLCFGEVLWDVLPEGRHAGGAPMNVAYHLSRLGLLGWPVSSVGNDDLGRELLRQLRHWGVACDLIGVVPGRATGTVQVTLDRGSPSYEIVRDVAWDYIDVPIELPDDCQPVAAIVYGSLAQRNDHNRRSLATLLERSASALRVLDVNLRPPFDHPDHVWKLAGGADLVKLNDEELVFLLGTADAGEDLEGSAREFAARADLERLCVTCGAAGAGLLDRGDWYWVDSRPVEVRDTIGAGDSFLAALVCGILTSPDRPRDNLLFASHLAGFVASSDGATPAYEISENRVIRP